MSSDDMVIKAAAARETLPLPKNFDGRIRDVCCALPDKTGAHRRRRLTPALAAAAILLLAGTALAAGVLDLSSMPDMLRRMVGTENVQTAPDAISYDSVEYAPGAFNADVRHAGQGMVYVSGGPETRIKDIYTVCVNVSTVTGEQAEKYVWRANIDGTDTWVEAQRTEALAGERLTLRMSFNVGDSAGDFRITLCGGEEGADGREFTVRRAGYYTLSPGQPQAVYTAVTKGADTTLNLQKAEYSGGTLALFYNAPELAAADANTPEGQKLLTAWGNSAQKFERGMTVSFADGTVRQILTSGALIFGDDGQIMEIAAVEGSVPASIMINGVSYGFIKSYDPKK